MNGKKFDPKKLAKLNNPQRLIDIPVDYIWEKLNIGSVRVLAEIGAGTAFFSTAFLNRAKAKKIYACDLSEEMIEWMKENICPEYPGIIPVKTKESAVPLNDGIADLVFMINLHHELDDPAVSVKEAFRLVKPGGSAFVVDWKKQEMAEGPPMEIRCEPGRVKHQMADAGFEQLNIHTGMKKHFLVTGKKALASL